MWSTIKSTAERARMQIASSPKTVLSAATQLAYGTPDGKFAVLEDSQQLGKIASVSFALDSVSDSPHVRSFAEPQSSRKYRPPLDENDVGDEEKGDNENVEEGAPHLLSSAFENYPTFPTSWTLSLPIRSWENRRQIAF